MQLWTCLPINLAGDEVSIVGGGVGADLAQMTRTSPLSLPQPTPANVISILPKNKKREKKVKRKITGTTLPSLLQQTIVSRLSIATKIRKRRS